jgi:hypothetical protein
LILVKVPCSSQAKSQSAGKRLAGSAGAAQTCGVLENLLSDFCGLGCGRFSFGAQVEQQKKRGAAVNPSSRLASSHDAGKAPTWDKSSSATSGGGIKADARPLGAVFGNVFGSTTTKAHAPYKCAQAAFLWRWNRKQRAVPMRYLKWNGSLASRLHFGYAVRKRKRRMRSRSYYHAD